MSKISVRARTGFTIPKAILEEDEDRRIAAGDEIRVPRDYGLHLIADHFAVLSSEPAGDDGDPEPIPLGKMTKEQLVAEAARVGIQIDASKAKAEILAAIEAASAA